MTTKLITNHHKLHVARQLQESVDELANTAYYVFVGVHVGRESNTIPEVLNNNRTVLIDAYRNMIMGKRVHENDLALMIRNIPYESGKVYDMYDDQDEDLDNKDYFCAVDEGSYIHVYKCLDNNRGAVSNAEPTFAHVVGANTDVYQTTDGYRWKYMYSFTSDQNVRFSTEQYIPLFPNNQVSAAAVDGAIDVILVEGVGEGYDNYVSGTFSTSNIRVGGDPTIYEISNNVASSTNGFYTGCLLYLATGTGAGQHAEIIDYYSNSSGKYIILDRSLETSPTNGTTYEIYPKVEIIGSGSQTVNAVARALVNSHASNSVYRVEMLNRGKGYDYATATVVANTYVDVVAPAELRPIYGPFKGHGYDAAAELGATRLGISVKFANTEGNTILTDSDFLQVGILKDPLFSEVVIETKEANGVFINEEKAVKISPIRIVSDATINTTSGIISSNTADFENQVSEGTILYLRSGDGFDHQIATVDSIANSSQIELTTNGHFACTETMVFLAQPTSNGIIVSSNSTHIVLANVAGVIQNNDMIIGESSGAKIVANTIIRSGVEKGFNTFIQLYKYIGTQISGEFEQNEVVYQNDLQTANAILHSAIDDAGTLTVYTSNQVGSFEVGGSINGSVSGAIALLTDKFGPELVFGSGDVVYLENIEPITRSNTSTETFQFILEF